jgi:hypothetical protein
MSSPPWAVEFTTSNQAQIMLIDSRFHSNRKKARELSIAGF